MYLLKLENVKMGINGIELFKNVTIEVKEKDRVALIGENGIGKTSLLKGIFGMAPLDGSIQLRISQDEIGWMMQDSVNDIELTVREWIEDSNMENSKLKRELNECIQKLSNQSDDEKLLLKYQQILQNYLDVNGYEWELEVERILNRFRISEYVWDIPFKNLSGGQKTRTKLARVMMNSPKLLILDEPTNHLDMETIDWLQGWLNRYNGSVLFISHERDFIDKVATITYKLTKNGTKKYFGGYSVYKSQKDHEMKAMRTLYEKQEQERKKLIETIQNYKNWYHKANTTASVRDPYAQKQASKQAAKFKAKEMALEKLEKERVDKPADDKSIRTSFEAKDFSGRRMIGIENVDFCYGDHTVLRELTIQVNRGDRLAVIGKNGSGKTTLLKLLAGCLIPTKGVVTRNPQLNIGFFFQELESLHQENSILEELLMIPNMTQAEARTLLACFLFSKNDVLKKIKNLSMGEKCRVAFIKLYFSNANLLILDEPTNYLDIDTREKIEEALVDYHGSVVIVAHDPYLLRNVANKVAIIENREVSYFPGHYQEWEQHSTVSSNIQALINQRQLLELELLRLLSEEMVETDEQKIENLVKINKLKQQITEIKKLIK